MYRGLSESDVTTGAGNSGLHFEEQSPHVVCGTGWFPAVRQTWHPRLVRGPRSLQCEAGRPCLTGETPGRQKVLTVQSDVEAPRAPQAWPGQRDGPTKPVGDSQVHMGPAPAPPTSVSKRRWLPWTKPGAGRCMLSGTHVFWNGHWVAWQHPCWSGHMRASRLRPPHPRARGPNCRSLMAPGLPWRQESRWIPQP